VGVPKRTSISPMQNTINVFFGQRENTIFAEALFHNGEKLEFITLKYWSHDDSLGDLSLNVS
jgi:hypothetical protein